MDITFSTTEPLKPLYSSENCLHACKKNQKAKEKYENIVSDLQASFEDQHTAESLGGKKLEKCQKKLKEPKKETKKTEDLKEASPQISRLQLLSRIGIASLGIFGTGYLFSLCLDQPKQSNDLFGAAYNDKVRECIHGFPLTILSKLFFN